MKKGIILAILIGIINACTKDNKENTSNDEFFGKWKLVAQLVDPGDGSGTFQDITSNKIIEFKANKTILSNRDICHMLSTKDSTTHATYNNKHEIISSSCSNQIWNPSFLLKDNDLIISYPCIEACKEKYTRTQ
ncbi:MAG: hypothetical protein V3U92_02965 [Cellulophaga sp.]